MKLYLLHPRDQIVHFMNRIYNNGMTTLYGGNFSIRDENGDTWITPAGIDKGKLQPSDIMCVKKDGTVVGKNKVSSEYPFHCWIYKKRPDLNAIVHAHSPALVSFSIMRQISDTNIIPQANHICGKVGYAPYALPSSEQLGENIANTFFDHRQDRLPEFEIEKHSSRERELRKEIVDIISHNNSVLLIKNECILLAGGSILEAFDQLEVTDFIVRSIIDMQSIGNLVPIGKDEVDKLYARFFGSN